MIGVSKKKRVKQDEAERNWYDLAICKRDILFLQQGHEVTAFPDTAKNKKDEGE